MTKNAKILLGCGSALLIGAVLLVVVLIGGYFLLGSDPNYEKAEAEGTQFSKGGDQTACMTEGFKRSKTIGLFDLTDSVNNGAFVEGCLGSARKVNGLCDGVPRIISSDSAWHESECRKAGLDPTASGCIGVTKAKQRYCEMNR